jgi:alpha-glucosidase (family GH31 glycosyl hydrolase)
VSLPPIRWYEWQTGEPVDGGSWFSVEHDLATLPMYVREGAVVPFGPEMAYVNERPAAPLTVRVAPFPTEGETTFRTNIAGAPIDLRYVAADGRHELRVRGAPGDVTVDALGGTPLDLVIER